MLYTCVPYFRFANTLLRRATVYRRIGFNRLGVTRNMGSDKEWDLSDVAKIEEVVDHPVELFRIWHNETRKYNATAPDACCLATTSKDCKVSARNVILREFDDDGFTIVTDNRSKKIDNVENISYAAMCFLWFYVNDQDQKVTKQVRIEGTMKRLDSEQYKHLYDREPLFCKIRSHVCDQGRVVDWEDLKRRHDEILDSVRRGENDLPMPDHFVGYKLFPTMMEFYFARDYLIGDRILYRKDTSNDAWERHRISA
ncbi:PREDICTED: pyridoxine/pyridoxamine 5'-phosphate oxidase isoform X1 [Eufriesea mexicana]|uniref:pyridoxine/pyridoxamine 5'-phosphate oxidase isoform X1 n=1 Tax=Eufriesea mexicana TaxID=516756 RepID=UPI00083C143A|nr:PREDICTED: pyridoxine/pyridoxamine 5'-phosphate oxidase isoform X1 [Eufriesea mexicana]